MTKKTWLRRREQQAWIGWLAASQLLDSALDQQLRRDSGITHATYGMMAALSSRPGRTMRMAEMAQMTNSSQSRLSHAVERMEAAGWVRRDRNPDNNREVLAYLTDEGFDVLRAAAPAHAARVRRLVFDRLDPGQVESLIDITRIVLGALAEEGFLVPDVLQIPGPS